MCVSDIGSDNNSLKSFCIFTSPKQCSLAYYFSGNYSAFFPNRFGVFWQIHALRPMRLLLFILFAKRMEVCGRSGSLLLSKPRLRWTISI